MENCNHIAYVASHEDARKLLNLLTVNLHEDLSYYHIKEEGISRKTLEALCNFEMIESSKSIAYGYSKEHVVKNSLYNITPYGENFINVFKQLATISKDTISAQLAVGDFRKFKEKLVIFLESNNPEEIREAYEFIFGTDGYSTNFYNRSKRKLISMYKSINRVKRNIFLITKSKDYENIIKDFEIHIIQFAEVVHEITQTLQHDAKDIEKYLTRLEKHKESNPLFFEERAKEIEGIHATDTSSTRLIEIVTKFKNSLEKDGIYRTYTTIINKIIESAAQAQDQLDQIKDQLTEKARLLEIAKEFKTMTDEDASIYFTKLISNKKINHISENENAHFGDNVLYITLPEVKVKEIVKQKAISKDELNIIKDQSTLISKLAEIERLKFIKQILETDVQKEILQYEVYTEIRNAIIATKEDDDNTTEIKLNTKIIPSNNNFIIRTKNKENKIQKLTFENTEVKLYVTNNINKEIESLQKECTILTTRIAHKKSNNTK